VTVAKILLFYVFTPLPDPHAVRLWQRDLAESLGLRGRILVSEDGINATVGGEVQALTRYLRKTRGYPAFAELDPTWSAGSGLDGSGASLDFPKLTVKVRDEIVSFGAPDDLRVDEAGVVDGGARLDPDALHALVDERGDDVVFFDGRNRIEAAIGRFRGALVPPVTATREFVAELDSGRYDHLKNRPIVTYCTGGVRCEVLSALMARRGFTEVYQLEGGIARYGERFGDDGLWEGSLYVFDRRGSVDFSDRAAVIGRCEGCGDATNRTANCTDLSCRAYFVVCAMCDAIACDAHAGYAERSLRRA
jgi:UPF0176 protein